MLSARIPSLVPRPRRQVLLQEPGHELEQVAAGSFALADAVGAVGVGHHRERLAQRDQAIDQGLAVLEVDVVVAGAVDQQQVALQALGMSDR